MENARKMEKAREWLNKREAEQAHAAAQGVRHENEHAGKTTPELTKKKPIGGARGTPPNVKKPRSPVSRSPEKKAGPSPPRISSISTRSMTREGSASPRTPAPKQKNAPDGRVRREMISGSSLSSSRGSSTNTHENRSPLVPRAKGSLPTRDERADEREVLEDIEVSRVVF